ncbi:MAG: enoyl-CoA hydratase/isomerase family protein [Candidatus Thermoplasmatota archaeon]|nr:enoyl-CoA hydratase/isomerase family protein [Candidatus Thermoplasmatota archaeon]
MADTSANISSEERDGIRIITIRKENKLNPLDVQTLEDIAGALSDKLLVTVIKGSERGYRVEDSRKEFQSLKPAEAYHFAVRGQIALDYVASYERPVIAAIRGFALGGGFELSLACDIRICSPDTRMGLPEVTLGILPGWGGTQRLRRIVGETRAFDLATTGRTIDAGEAKALGIVSEVSEKPEEDAIERAKTYAKSALVSVGMIKSLVRGKEFDLFDSEKEAFGKIFETEDSREGVRAFLEKRKPSFRNR